MEDVARREATLAAEITKNSPDNLLIIVFPAALQLADRKQGTHQAGPHTAMKPKTDGPNPDKPDGFQSFSSLTVCFI